METNYDTDADGKRDLVKALVQIPRAAMEGDYKAATIYEARPYITGCTSGEAPYGKDGYDLDQMYSQPAARKAAGTATRQQPRQIPRTGIITTPTRRCMTMRT